MDSKASRPSVDIVDDLRQAAIVGKYEAVKFFSGKKIFIYLGLMIFIFAILTYVLFALSPDDYDDVADATATYFSFVTLFLLIGATLFSSVSLVSEFEDRTAFTLFTKPVHKYSIFLGKFVSAYILNMTVMLIYSILSVIAVAIKLHGFAPEIFAAFGYCSLYAFALSGIATLFSSIMKKSSSASIMTFIFILFVPSIMAVILLAIARAGDVMDFWYVLDVAANSMIDCFSKPVNGVRDALVMAAYGVFTAIPAYLIFSRREI